MWVSDRHPQRDQLLARQHGQAAPPEPSGETLAEFPRRGKYGSEEALRVSLDQFEGHPYISIRVWSRDNRSGQWWPLKGRGVSVRISEAEGVAQALNEALERAQESRPLQRQGAGR